MNHYIIIVSPVEGFNGKLIDPVFIAKGRVTHGYWPFYQSTSHRKELQAGDNALIYLAGETKYSQKILGWVRIEGIEQNVRKIPKFESALVVPKPTDIALITKYIFFDELIPIKPLVSKLSFILNPEQWGKYMQGGCKKISADDFDVVLNATKLS